MNAPLTPQKAVAHARRLSRFFARLLDGRPGLEQELLDTLEHPFDAGAMRTWLEQKGLRPGLEAMSADSQLKPLLRQLRARAMAHFACRDLAGLADLEEITGGMTDLADVTVEVAQKTLHAVLALRHGQPLDSKGRPQDMICIGMGKLGGRELNVSSDVDFIFVYPEDGDTDGRSSIGNFEFFSRLGRRLIDALDELTADGRVFRVDMRLRPNGDSGPLVSSLDMLENYFITQGREWERYAWIKARPMTGGRHDELARLSRPFIFRKYLDFGAINAMRDLHAQIRREVARKDMADNIKLGPGGIREIEFIAQVFQLIRGGRDPSLQIKPTLQVLKRLARRGIVTEATVRELTSAYVFLRRLEHRLQFLDDAQTHMLPAKAEDQALIAAGMGFSTYEGLLAELDDHRATVSQQFEQVFGDPNRGGHSLSAVWTGADGGSQCAGDLARLGYHDVVAVAQRLASVRSSGRYQQMPAGIRSRFDALMPRVIEAAAGTKTPDLTLERILKLLEAISRRAAYLAFLQQYPQALTKLAEFAAASSWAAGYLTQHPILLDELLDPRLLEADLDLPTFRQELQTALDEVEPDMERQMDLMREAHHTQVFHLLAQDLSGVFTVERLADQLSELADVILDVTILETWRKLPRRHRETPRFAIISYGKQGGKELGYASDLDLVFIYDDEDQDAGAIYSRLGQRISTWLSSRTSAGQLFDTDLRLRPNGESGLLVISTESFRRYQLESAWVWEHQALSRARFSAGDLAVGEAFERIRCEVLQQQRDHTALRKEVADMRARMYGEHGGKSELFDLKHDRGGLIDVEFIVQFLVLAHAHAHPELTRNLGNIALVNMAGDLGLIPADLARRVADAYRELRRRQHVLRLNDTTPKVAPEEVAQERAAVTALWSRVFAQEAA